MKKNEKQNWSKFAKQSLKLILSIIIFYILLVKYSEIYFRLHIENTEVFFKIWKDTYADIETYLHWNNILLSLNNDMKSVQNLFYNHIL